MRSPHTVEIPFVFNNIAIAGPLISKMPRPTPGDEGQRVVGRVRANRQSQRARPARLACVHAATRDTMLFNNASRVAQDPGPRARVLRWSAAEAVGHRDRREPNRQALTRCSTI